MEFLLKRILLVTFLLVSLLMLIGVGVVVHDTIAIREAEEIEEDSGKALLLAQKWINHQGMMEVAVRDYLIFAQPASVEAIAENQRISVEEVAELQRVLGEYDDKTELRLLALLQLAARHQELMAQIVAFRQGGDLGRATHILNLDEYGRFVDDAKLHMEEVTHRLDEKRSDSNSNVSLNVMRGSVSFALLAVLMISVLWVSYLITVNTQQEKARLARQLGFEATHDSLTGLPNRRYMQDHLARAIDLASRHHMRLGVLVIDLDGFKAVNDSHGHSAGDRVLEDVARRFKIQSRASDLVVRTGGDEFAVIAENVEQPDSLKNLAQRLVECLRPAIELDANTSVSVGCSIGIAIFPDHATTLDALFAAADQAMYAAKDAGKNCWRAPPA
jgi:diguanylate cyclase (GGDEF)-like protein